MNYNTTENSCQAIIDELSIRKRIHGKIIDELCKSFKTVEKATPEKESRLRDCASYIEINKSGQIVSSNFCKNRYCPICQWRKSRKTFALALNIQNEIEEKGNFQFLFLTLTLKNSKNLSQGIDHILQSFKRLQDTKRFRRIVKGFIRTLEITYNQKTQEWHPHIHAIIAVDSNYFTEKELYTDYEQWRVLWKTVAHVDYFPQCNIQKINEEERTKAIAEISKYMVKPIDLEISKESEEIYTHLLKSTFGRRLSSAGGIYKEVAREIKNKYETGIEEIKKGDVLNLYQFTGYNYIHTRKTEIN